MWRTRRKQRRSMRQGRRWRCGLLRRRMWQAGDRREEIRRRQREAGESAHGSVASHIQGPGDSHTARQDGYRSCCAPRVAVAHWDGNQGDAVGSEWMSDGCCGCARDGGGGQWCETSGTLSKASPRWVTAAKESTGPFRALRRGDSTPRTPPKADPKRPGTSQLQSRRCPTARL